jgi:putative membrane protein
MVAYDPKEWIRPLFQFHKSDTFRKLFPLLIGISIFTWGIAYIEIKYLRLSENSHIKNVTLMHNLLGFAISMLLVFRTNTAYDRWWEGRKLWGGLVNNSRNLAVKLHTLLPIDDKRNRSYFKKLLGLFPHELHVHLLKEATRLELDKNPHPEIPNFDRSKHVPTQVVLLMQSRINELLMQQKISGEQLIFLNSELISFLDICGACERIKNTPIPYSYSTFIKKFIFIYVLTLPLGLAFSLGYIAIPVVVFVFYILASLELIAEEIEDPFGLDANDLPMDQMAMNIKKNVEDIL